MAGKRVKGQAFNLLCVAQAGRLEYEAVLLALSFRAANPGFKGRLIVAEPQPGPLWKGETRLSSPVRALLEAAGAEILPFEARVFGQDYPQGNKIEALGILPANEPFVFFDTDTLFTAPIDTVRFDFARPSASMRREGTWPDPPLYGPGFGAIWKSLYDRFGLEFESSLDLSQPDEYWRRYLYFNAGWFFGADPAEFGALFLRYAQSIRDDPPDALASQALFPWLDQIALPLVIHALGGGRPGPDLDGLDGDVSCHWRALPLLYARESDRAVAVLEEIARPNPVKKVLRGSEAMRKLVYQGKGQKLRALFDRKALPRREQALRNAIRREGLWLR